jgi:hypothetical protein
MRNPFVSKNSLTGILATISELKDEQFSLLESAVSGPRSFEIGYGKSAALSSDLGMAPTTVGQLTSALGFLYRNIQDLAERDPLALEQKIDEMLVDLDLNEQVSPEMFSLLSTRLKRVLRFADNHERFLKVSRLEAGFMPRLVASSSFVDLRPSFDADRSAIECLVPLVQINLQTDSQRDDEANLILQLDLQGVEILRRLIEDIDAKVRVLKSHPGFNTPLFTSDEGKL